MSTTLKKPLSAYMLFAAEIREIVKAEVPGSGVAQQAKVIGERWRGLRDSERKWYEEKHADNKRAYEVELATAPSAQMHHDPEDDDDESAAVALPLSRVKRIIKLDPEISKVTGDAAFLITVATELFLNALVQEAAAVATERGKKTITEIDMARAAARNEALRFLSYDLRVPSAAEEAATKAKRIASRKQVNATDAGDALGPGQEQQAVEREEEYSAMAVDAASASTSIVSAAVPLAGQSLVNKTSIITLFAKIAAARPQVPSCRVVLGAKLGIDNTPGTDIKEVVEDENEEEAVDSSARSRSLASDRSLGGLPLNSSIKKGHGNFKGKGRNSAAQQLPSVVGLDRFMVRVGSAEEATARLFASMEAAHAGETFTAKIFHSSKGSADGGMRPAARGQGRVRFASFAQAAADIEEINDRDGDVDLLSRGHAEVTQGNHVEDEDSDEFDLSFIRRKAGKSKRRALGMGSTAGAR